MSDILKDTANCLSLVQTVYFAKIAISLSFGLGKLVQIQHCPRNGKNEKPILINLTDLHHCMTMWEGGLANEFHLEFIAF